MDMSASVSSEEVLSDMDGAKTYEKYKHNAANAHN